MTQALEDLRIAYNWAMSGDADQAAQFLKSALDYFNSDPHPFWK